LLLFWWPWMVLLGREWSNGGRWNRQSHHLHYLMTSIFTRAWKFPLNYVTMIYEKNGIYLLTHTTRERETEKANEFIYLLLFLFFAMFSEFIMALFLYSLSVVPLFGG
jgi:hypothetical protein